MSGQPDENSPRGDGLNIRYDRQQAEDDYLSRRAYALAGGFGAISQFAEETVSHRARRMAAAVLSMLLCIVALACSPEVGSRAWCEKMEETPKGDWSTNDAVAYAKHCVLE